MIARKLPPVIGHDSAYPGSMSEREDGYYICRNDHVSLAAALVELIASRDREIDDLRNVVTQTHPINHTPGTVPMHSCDTTVGEGDMPVTCRFDFDHDGEIETMQVWAGAGAVNIFRALTLSQIEALETECYAAAKADNEERKFDTAIDNFIEGQQS